MFTLKSEMISYWRHNFSLFSPANSYHFFSEISGLKLWTQKCHHPENLSKHFGSPFWVFQNKAIYLPLANYILVSLHRHKMFVFLFCLFFYIFRQLQPFPKSSSCFHNDVRKKFLLDDTAVSIKKIITAVYVYACVCSHMHCELNKNVVVPNLTWENQNITST